MRVLVLTSTFPRWRGDREPPFVFELCRRLAASHELLVLAPHCPGAATEERLAERLTVCRFRYAPERLESLAYEGGILEDLDKPVPEDVYPDDLPFGNALGPHQLNELGVQRFQHRGTEQARHRGK